MVLSHLKSFQNILNVYTMLVFYKLSGGGGGGLLSVKCCIF